MKETANEKSEMVRKLESDVERLTRGKQITAVPDDPELTTDELLAASLLAAEQAAASSQESAAAAAVGEGGEGGGGRGQSIVDIVRSQRDRMKQRLIEVEELLANEKTECAKVRSEATKLREDNTQLYGKMRFLQSHKGSSTTVTIDESGTYKQDWERKMNPFERFTSQETLRHVQKLPIHEKATLSIARLVLSNATARFVFFCYLVVLHLLVFMVCYHSAWSSASSRDDCLENFAKHMVEHHH